jgi:hypothetical protein
MGFDDEPRITSTNTVNIADLLNGQGSLYGGEAIFSTGFERDSICDK